MRYSWKKANKAFYTVFLTMMIICLSHISANAASYTPRLSLPADARTSIKEYRVNASYGWGNYNPYSAFSVGNCTWYAFGRAWEILGYFPEKLIFDGDAEVWFNYNKANYDSGNGGFPYSTDRNAPALGAIAVWENTSDAYGSGGHVAVVEQITDNGNGTKTIVTSESAYSSYYFQTIERNTAHEGLGWSGKWRFLGYIYLGDFFPSPTPVLQIENASPDLNYRSDEPLTLSWSKCYTDFTGYNLFVAKHIEGTANYNWENSRIYLPGVDSTRHTFEAGSLSPGGYAAYVQTLNASTGETGPQSNFIYFVVVDSVSVPTIINPPSGSTCRSDEPLTIRWRKCNTDFSGYNLFVAKNIQGTIYYNWDNSRIYLPGADTTSYTFEAGSLSPGGYAAYAQTLNVITGETGPQSEFIYFVVSSGTTVPTEYTITYDANGGNGAPDSQTKYQDIDLTLQKQTPTRDYYTFLGWAVNDPEASTPDYAPEDVFSLNEDVTLYAVWEKIEYDVTFYVNHEVDPNTGIEGWIRKVTYGDPFGELPVPEWEGYTFNGWFTQEAGGTQITAESLYTGGTTFYAHWSANEYTLTFDVNMAGMENPASRKIRYKEAFGDLPVCTSDDYDFLGWFDAVNGTRKFTSASVYNYTTDLTVYAKWEQKEIPHEHSYVSEVTTESTCTETGVRTYTCECGDTYTEEIPMKGHTAEDTRTGVKEATCTEDGYTGDILCKDCKTVVEKGTVVPKTGHQHKTVRDAEEATCTATGYTGDTYCIDCETKISEGKVIPALGHDWVAGDVIKEVTCTEAGEQKYTCSRCSETKTEPIPVTGHLGNSILRFVKAASCTAPGYTGDTYCNKCYELIKEGTVIPATGHQHTTVRNVKKATCSQEGYTGDTYCIDCEELVEAGSSIPKADHSWDAGTVTKEATDTEDGEKTFQCTVCGDTKTEKIEKLKPTPAPAPAANPILGNLTSLEGKAKALSENGDPVGSSFNILQVKGKKVKKTSIALGWKAVPKAAGYVIYGAPCGSKYAKLTTVKGTSYTQGKLQKGKYYKYFVAAYDKNGNILASSKTVHIATAGGKKGNTKSVKLNKKKVTLKKGKTFKLKATLKNGELKVSKHRKVTFETDNPKVATVSKSGKVKAVGAGKCIVYAYAQNGVFAKCKITVK